MGTPSFWTSFFQRLWGRRPQTPGIYRLGHEVGEEQTVPPFPAIPGTADNGLPSFEEEKDRLTNNNPVIADTMPTISFQVKSASAPVGTVLAGIKEVVSLVIDHSTRPWPSDEAWRTLLPPWLLAGFVPDKPAEQAAREAEHFRKLLMENHDEFVAFYKENNTWDLPNWIYWMHPDNRYWRWGRAETRGDSLSIQLTASDFMIPSEAFEALLKIAGGTEIEKYP